MKVLVTGASGLLGSNVVRELVSRGYDVKVLVRPQSSLKGIFGLKIDLAYGNITDYQSVSRAVGQCDFVIHCAAHTNIKNDGYAEFDRVNIKGSENLVKAAYECKVKKIVYVSTANTFGMGTRKHIISDAVSPDQLIRTKSNYIKSKCEAQKRIIECARLYSVPLVCINPTFMIGPYDSKPSSGKVILMGLKNKIVVCPNGGKNFVAVKDVANAVSNAITYGKEGECYLIANKNLTYWQFYRALRSVAGKRLYILKIPDLLLKAAGICFDLLKMISRRGYALNYENSKMLCECNFYRSTRASDELKIKYTPLTKAMEEAVEWFKGNGYLSSPQLRKHNHLSNQRQV